MMQISLLPPGLVLRFREGRCAQFYGHDGYFQHLEYLPVLKEQRMAKRISGLKTEII